MLKLSIGSCMLRLGFRLSIRSCMLRLRLSFRGNLTFNIDIQRQPMSRRIRVNPCHVSPCRVRSDPCRSVPSVPCQVGPVPMLGRPCRVRPRRVSVSVSCRRHPVFGKPSLVKYLQGSGDSVVLKCFRQDHNANLLQDAADFVSGSAPISNVTGVIR